MKSDGIPNITLQDRMRFLWVFDGLKHDLMAKGQSAQQYADEKINALSQAEFLEAISEHLEEMKVDALTEFVEAIKVRQDELKTQAPKAQPEKDDEL